MRIAIRMVALATLALTWSVAAPAVEGQAQLIQRDISYLADDALEGRGVGTDGLDLAAAYLAGRMFGLGLEPGVNGRFLQTFELDPSAPALAHSGIGAVEVSNVVGVIPGRGDLASEVVVLGAHYDHLGLGATGGSLDPDSMGVVHNGADDNASGTAALLEAARLLLRLDVPSHRTMVFVAFTAEELGLLGSAHYVGDPAYPNEATVAMINFDMVGRVRDDKLIVIGTGSAEGFEDLVRANNNTGLDLAFVDDPWGRSDHSSFYAAGLPVLHLFSDTHPEYHRTADDADLINAEGAARVARLAADVATALATRREALAFIDVPQRQTSGGGGYGAYLGSIPDMSGNPGGVRFTGVRSGSPAEQAGLQAGDILVEFGGKTIGDLFDMTDALREHRPGETVVVVVKRGEEQLSVEVTLGTRGD